MKIFVGIPSYNRVAALRLCLRSFVGSKLVRGFVIVADAASASEAEEYAVAVKFAMDAGFEVIHDIRVGRRGSAKARNNVFELAIEGLGSDDVLVTYDDDYIHPGDHALAPVLRWLKDPLVGVIGGRIVNLRRRKIDPDFALNVPYLADILTKLTGFIILNNKHGPREVDYTTHLMAIAVRILGRGIRYDNNYKGSGYREESDLQRQVKALGYKIIFEPRFFAYHLAMESGGDRYSDLEDRMYWKWRNHTYFMNKWGYPLYKKVLSYAILTTYAVLNGPPAVNGIVRAVRG
jgi:GT2 family glycosyltransferase